MLGKIKRFFTKKRGKTGASLLIVIVTVSMLIVMGTTFGFIAMGAYNNSNRRLCQQQAYLTAETCLGLLQKQFAEDSDKVIKVADALNSVYLKEHQLDNDISRMDERVTYKVAHIDGGLPKNSLEAGLMGLVGECIVMATYADEDAATIRLRATATYKGYSESLSARMACTTSGALELRKIFSNAQCWNSPIVTLIADQTSGDMYFSSPGMYDRWSNGEVKETPENYRLRDEVYGHIPTGAGASNSNCPQYVHTKPFDIDNRPVKCRGLRCLSREEVRAIPLNKDHSSADGSTEYNNNMKILNDAYNKILGTKTTVEGQTIDNYEPSYGTEYRMAYYSPTHLWTDHPDGVNNGDYATQLPNAGVIADHWGNALWFEEKRSGKFHVKYKDHPFYGDETKTWNNDWTEIYMFTGDAGANSPAIVNGDMYVNTRALIGLSDKNATQIHYWPIIDEMTDRGKAERKYVSYFGSNYFANAKFKNKYIDGNDLGLGFEHGLGANQNVFFDYTNTSPDYTASTLCLNGNMFLFEDARIECFDSTHTPNANRGVKNNIYAHKKLVIDGIVSDIPAVVADKDKPEKFDFMPNKRNVKIFGDVMCEDDLTIADAIIYGDIYCNGNQLIMNNVDVYGNVYFNGYKCRIDNSNIWTDGKRVLREGDQHNLIDLAGNSVDKYSFETDTMRCIQLKGGDFFVLGNVRDNSRDTWKTAAEKAAENASRTLERDGLRDCKKHADDKAPTSWGEAEKRFKSEAEEGDMYGAVFVNANIDGTLISNMDTRIQSRYGPYLISDVRSTKNATSRRNYTVEELLTTDKYGDIDGPTNIAAGNLDYSRVEIGSIYCSGYLFIDPRHLYLWDDEVLNTWWPHVAGIGWTPAKVNGASRGTNYIIELVHNRITVKNVIACKRLQVMQQQIADDIREEMVKDQWYIVDKEFVEEGLENVLLNDPNAACRNVKLNKVFVDGGGFYIDGNNIWWRNHDTQSTGTFRIARSAHRGIGVGTLYSTATNTYNGMWDTEGYVSRSQGQTWVLDGYTGYHYDNDYHKLNTKTALDMRKEFIDEAKTAIASQLGKAKSDVKIVDYTEKTAPTFDEIMTSITAYYSDVWADHINAYYGNKDNQLGTLTGPELKDWATNNKGMYPAYEEDAKLGVWREISILKWSAPIRKVEDYCYDKVVPLVGDQTVPEITINDLYLDALSLHPFRPGKSPIRYKAGEYIIKKNVNIVAPSGGVAAKLVIPADTTVIFDTTGRVNNIHCLFEGGIRLETGAKIVLRGGNMTFIYLGKETTENTQTGYNPDNNVILDLGANAKIGEVVNGHDESIRRDSIYFISNTVGLIEFGYNSSIYGYIYTPKSFVHIDESLGEHKEGATNTILRGSMLAAGFKVNMGLDYADVHKAYKNLRYEYVTAPLILDKNLQYGDTDQQIQDFHETNWGFIGYD